MRVTVHHQGRDESQTLAAVERVSRRGDTLVLERSHEPNQRLSATSWNVVEVSGE